MFLSVQAFLYSLQQSALNVTLTIKIATALRMSLANTYTQLASKLATVDETLRALSCRLESVISVAEAGLTQSQRETAAERWIVLLAQYDTFEEKLDFSPISDQKELMKYIFRCLNSIGDFMALWKDAVELGRNIGQ